jgi:hypothetical protein
MFKIKVLSMVFVGFLLASCEENSTSSMTNHLPNKTEKEIELSQFIDDSDINKLNKNNIEKFSLELKRNVNEICYLYQKSDICIITVRQLGQRSSFKYTGVNERLELSLLNGAWEVAFSYGFKDAISSDDAKLIMWQSVVNIDSQIKSMKNNIEGNRASWTIKDKETVKK